MEQLNNKKWQAQIVAMVIGGVLIFVFGFYSNKLVETGVQQQKIDTLEQEFNSMRSKVDNLSLQTARLEMSVTGVSTAIVSLNLTIKELTDEMRKK